MWYPPLNWLNFEDTTLFDEDAGFQYKYSMSFYYSVLILGSNEIGPVNMIEMFYICCMLVLNLFISLFLLSDLISVITDFSKDDIEFQGQLDAMNEVMVAINLVEEDKDQIREFFRKTTVARNAQSELNEFLNILKPSLQQVTVSEINKKKLSTNRVI